MQKQRYGLFKGLKRLTEKYNKVRYQIGGLLNMRFYTEQEMVETMIAEAEEGTFFECSYYGFDVDTFTEISPSYVFTLYCDDYIVDGKIDTKLLREDFYKKRGA